MTTEELQRRVNESPALSALSDRLTEELAAQSNNAYQFDPITIITIISIVIQVIIHCRENNSDESIQQSMRELRTLPPRKLMRLRRRLNNVWREHCAKTGVEYAADNPVVSAVYTLSATIDDAAATVLMELAAAQ